MVRFTFSCFCFSCCQPPRRCIIFSPAFMRSGFLPSLSPCLSLSSGGGSLLRIPGEALRVTGHMLQWARCAHESSKRQPGLRNDSCWGILREKGDKSYVVSIVLPVLDMPGPHSSSAPSLKFEYSLISSSLWDFFPWICDICPGVIINFTYCFLGWLWVLLLVTILFYSSLIFSL